MHMIVTSSMSGRFSLRWAGATTLALAAVVAVSGCSSPEPFASETVSGVPAGVTLTDDEQSGEQPVAVWRDDRATLTVITWGSSSCPPVPTSLERESAPLLQLRFAPPTDQACTADYAPTGHIFETPDGTSADAVRLEIVFEAREGEQPTELTIPIRDSE
jgi:hypothetical protein